MTEDLLEKSNELKGKINALEGDLESLKELLKQCNPDTNTRKKGAYRLEVKLYTTLFGGKYFELEEEDREFIIAFLIKKIADRIEQKKILFNQL